MDDENARVRLAVFRIREMSAGSPGLKEIYDIALAASQAPIADPERRRAALEEIKVLAAAGGNAAIHALAEQALAR